MDAATEIMTGELRDELASNERITDTRAVRVRNFHLKQMGKSPAHCRYAMLSGFDEPSLIKRLGSGVHSLLLGGQPLIRYNGKRDLRTKAYQEFAAANQNAIICSPSEYETANRTADAVRNDRLASEVLLSSGLRYEQTIEWDWMGRSRRCTPDVNGPDLLAELKTTRDASLDRFRWDVLRYGYHTQLSDYATAILETRGHAPRDVFIVAVEKKPPYVCATYRLSKNDLEIGARQLRGWMERLLECEKNNDWPGYCRSVQDLDLPTREEDLNLIFGDEDDATESTAP
jgi:hypothetical protein